MLNGDAHILLVGETFSPWTKKARWALEHCNVPYQYEEYTPTLSEPKLRWRLKQIRGTVSVPTLFVGTEVFKDSFEIAEYASRRVTNNPFGDFSRVKEWNELSERALAEGRTRVVRRIKENAAALQESLPKFVPEKARIAFRPIARYAVDSLDRKYANLAIPGSMRDALTRTRRQLNKRHGLYLLGDFSYADIAMAVVVELIESRTMHEPALGPATESCWGETELVAEFADLIEWRNKLAENKETSYSQFAHMQA